MFRGLCFTPKLPLNPILTSSLTLGYSCNSSPARSVNQASSICSHPLSKLINWAIGVSHSTPIAWRLSTSDDMEFTRKKLACLFVLLLTYTSSSRVTQQTQKWMTRLSPTSPRDQSTSQLKRVTNGVLVGLSTAALAINIRTPVLAVHAKSSTVRPSALEMKEVCVDL